MKYAHYLSCLTLVFSSLATADDNHSNWTGPYVGANLGVIWNDATVKANHFNFVSNDHRYDNSFTGVDVNPGLQFGYLYQFDQNWVFGGEADFTFASNKSRYRQTNATGSAYDQFTVRNNLQGSLRLRAGYAIDRFLPFVTAGVSFGDLGFHYDNESGNAYGKNTTQTGWVLGGGVEYGLLDNVSTRLEYLYTDYGHALNTGIPTVSGIADSSASAQADLATHVLRAAVNYRF